MPQDFVISRPNFNNQFIHLSHRDFTPHASFLLIPLRKDSIYRETSILPAKTALSIIRDPSQASSTLHCHRGKYRSRGPSLTLKCHLFPATPTPPLLPPERKGGSSKSRRKGEVREIRLLAKKTRINLNSRGDTVMSHSPWNPHETFGASLPSASL